MTDSAYAMNLSLIVSVPVFKVYHGHDSSGGFMSTIPLVSENILIHDAEGTTYDNGCSIVMQRLVVCQHVIHLFKIKKKSSYNIYVSTRVFISLWHFYYQRQGCFCLQKCKLFYH